MTYRAWILGVLLCLSTQTAQAVTTDELRAHLAADANAAPGQQYITFGPMKDGRKLIITTQMVNNSNAVTITQAAPDTFVIRMGRNMALNAVYLTDAMLICARFPNVACSRMAAYVERVRMSRTPAEAPFLDEVYPDLLDAARETRADEALYKASLSAGLQSLMLMVTLHETGHAALRHLEHEISDPAAQIREEGEADGFAAHVAGAANMLPAGMAAPFTLDAVEETVSGKAPVTHPPALCRAVVMNAKTVEWVRKNEKELAAPGGGEKRDQMVKQLLGQISSGDISAGMSAATAQNCQQYAASFAAGIERARELVDENTLVDSTVPGQR